jgi:hypothetical protein
MVCYIVPLLASLAAFLTRKASHSQGRNSLHLNIMLLGGALFGLIDHAWNSELLLMGPNLYSDLALGFAITLGITGAWGLITLRARLSSSLAHISQRLGLLKG